MLFVPPRINLEPFGASWASRERPKSRQERPKSRQETPEKRLEGAREAPWSAPGGPRAASWPHICRYIYTRCSNGGAKAPPISRDVPSLRRSEVPKFRLRELKPETPELKPETPELKPETPNAKARDRKR